jgi:Carbohydrate family 9 binding domain-like
MVNKFLSALMLLACFPASAQEFPRKYEAVKVSKAPVIDGKIGKDEWAKAAWSEYFIDIEGDKKPTPALKTRMKMLWDDKHLYILADMKEPHLWATLTDRDEMIYRDHDFEVFIDPDGDTNEYVEIEINALGTEMDLFMHKPYKKGGPMDLKWNTEGLKTAVGLHGTLNKNDDIDEGWVVEMAIPFEALTKGKVDKIYKPEPGKPWRINFSRVEWTLDNEGTGYKKRNGANGKPIPEYNWVWTPQGVIDMHVPEKWGLLYFRL